MDGMLSPMSKMLDNHQTSYPMSKKELYAIVFGIQKYRHYLTGKHFTVITDHAALQYLLNLKEPQGRLNRWSLLLREYDCTVEYRRGKLDRDADLSSRNPLEKPTEEDDCGIPLHQISCDIKYTSWLILEHTEDDCRNQKRKLLLDLELYGAASRHIQRKADQV